MGRARGLEAVRQVKAMAGAPTVVAMALFALPAHVEAQGVTTSTLTGRVTDESGAPLSNVEVVITNTSTGEPSPTV